MQFSDTTYNQGIVQEIDFYADSDPSIYAINDKTRNVNRWLDICVNDIIQSNNRWQWDDPNQTTLPSGTTQINANQNQYSFDSTWLTVQRVDIQDSNGNWTKLNPIDNADIGGAVEAFQTTPGVPQNFDVDGENIILYPTPSYTLASAMRVYFQRLPVYFVPSDTTKAPGFAAPFHRILSLGAAADWCLTKNLSKYTNLMNQITPLRADLKGFYGSRNEYEHIRIVPQRRNQGSWGNYNGDYT